MEAATGVEPVMEVLQTSALPLGYAAPHARRPARFDGGAADRRRQARRNDLAPPTRAAETKGQTTEPTGDPLLCPTVPSDTWSG